MTLDTDSKIATGRSWRDLPDAPPVADVAASDAATPPPPARIAEVGPVEPTTSETTLDNAIPAVTGARVERPVASPVPAHVPPPPRRRRSLRPWIAGLAGVVVLLAGLVVWSPWSEDAGPGTPAASGTVDADGMAADPLAGVDEPVAAVAVRLHPSVVQIDRSGGVGSGFVYDRDGLILTAAHIVAGATEVTVRTSDGTELVGRVLGGDPVADVAVVEVDGDLTPAPLALARPVHVGQMAVAVGSPLGFGQTVTSGIVSGIDRRITVSGTTLDGLIQTDAPINQGNSGGPLADRSGEVIGVNVTIATASGGSDGLGLVVSIDKALEIAARFTADLSDRGRLEPVPGEGLDESFPDLVDPGGLLPPELRGLLDDMLGDPGLSPELRGLLEGLRDGSLMSPDRSVPPGMDGPLEDLLTPDSGTRPDGTTGPDLGELLEYFLFEFGSSPFPEEGQETAPDLGDLWDLFSGGDG